MQMSMSFYVYMLLVLRCFPCFHSSCQSLVMTSSLRRKLNVQHIINGQLTASHNVVSECNVNKLLPASLFCEGVSVSTPI